MTENDIKLRASEFYSKLDLDKYPSDQRTAAVEMAKALCLMAAQIVCGLKSRNEAPEGIDPRDWNDLYSLLQIANGILNEREKAAFIRSVKKIITTRDPRDVEFDTLCDLQSMIRSHIYREQKGGEIDASL